MVVRTTLAGARLLRSTRSGCGRKASDGEEVRGAHACRAVVGDVHACRSVAGDAIVSDADRGVRVVSPDRGPGCVWSCSNPIENSRAVRRVRRRAGQLPFCAEVAYSAHPLPGHGAISSFPSTAVAAVSNGDAYARCPPPLHVERYRGVAYSLSGPPSTWPTSTAGSPWYQAVAVPRPTRDTQAVGHVRSPAPHSSAERYHVPAG